MTKAEAYEAMLEGHMIRHYHYTPEEYTYINKNEGQIYTEDGYPKGGRFDEFWSVYQKWEDGWEIVEPELVEPDKTLISNEYLKGYDSIVELNNPYHGLNLDEVVNKPLKRGSYVDVRTEPKTGRNEPCPCGSGKKYKKCCL